MPMFRPISKPVEARQWTGKNTTEIRVWLGYAWIDWLDSRRLLIENRDGRVIANLDDFIVKSDGFYPVEPIKFWAEYEAAT